MYPIQESFDHIVYAYFSVLAFEDFTSHTRLWVGCMCSSPGIQRFACWIWIHCGRIFLLLTLSFMAILYAEHGGVGRCLG
jgi:hypothetical protein